MEIYSKFNFLIKGKILYHFRLILLVIMLTFCSNTNIATEKNSSHDTSIFESSTISTYSERETTEVATLDFANLDRDAYQKQLLEEVDVSDELVYTNHIHNYQLTFPENWRGWFVIEEKEGYISVNFLGRSNTGIDPVPIPERGMGKGYNLFYVVYSEDMIGMTMDRVIVLDERIDETIYYINSSSVFNTNDISASLR